MPASCTRTNDFVCIGLYLIIEIVWPTLCCIGSVLIHSWLYASCPNKIADQNINWTDILTGIQFNLARALRTSCIVLYRRVVISLDRVNFQLTIHADTPRRSSGINA